MLYSGARFCLKRCKKWVWGLSLPAKLENRHLAYIVMVRRKPSSRPKPHPLLLKISKEKVIFLNPEFLFLEGGRTSICDMPTTGCPPAAVSLTQLANVVQSFSQQRSSSTIWVAINKFSTGKGYFTRTPRHVQDWSLDKAARIVTNVKQTFESFYLWNRYVFFNYIIT
jgi:hypothetical protein